jgi:hypothetical protein
MYPKENESINKGRIMFLVIEKNILLSECVIEINTHIIIKKEEYVTKVLIQIIKPNLHK